MHRLVTRNSEDASSLSLMDFDQVWELPVEKSITRHRTSDVGLVRLDNSDSTLVFRKRYWHPGLYKKLKGFFRNTFFKRSRAHQEFLNLNLLYSHSLSKIKAIAYGEERCFRFLNRSLLLTEQIPDSLTLEQWVSDNKMKKLKLREKRVFICALARWVYALHSRGFKDKGMFSRNIIVHSIKGGFSFSKIDSPKGAGGNKAMGLGAPYLKDLKDLDSDLLKSFSRSDRLRALMAYAGSGKADQEIRELIFKILN